MRLVRPLFVVLALAALFAGPAGAAPTPAPADPALAALPAKMAAALIAGDAATLRAACAPSSTIIDEFAPYTWSGPDACVRWANAFKAFAKQMQLTGFKAKVAPNPFIDASAKNAYMVAKVQFTAMMAGKPIPEEGTWTFVVAKSGADWKITALAWGTLHH